MSGRANVYGPRRCPNRKIGDLGRFGTKRKFRDLVLDRIGSHAFEETLPQQGPRLLPVSKGKRPAGPSPTQSQRLSFLSAAIVRATAS
jgi:hypothetical protein